MTPRDLVVFPEAEPGGGERLACAVERVAVTDARAHASCGEKQFATARLSMLLSY